MKIKKIVLIFGIPSLLLLCNHCFAMQAIKTKIKKFDAHNNTLKKEVISTFEKFTKNITKQKFEHITEKFTKQFHEVKQFDELFVLKRSVTPDTKIAIHADIHGEKDALFSYLQDLCDLGYLDEKNPFKIKHENTYLCFLGDYVDRGEYSIEVLCIIMELKMENPHKVIMLRGNHENSNINKREDGLGEKLEKKFGYTEDEWVNMVDSIYNLFPLAAYIHVAGTPNYVLLCHGGLEPRYNPHDMLSIQHDAYHSINKLDTTWLPEELQAMLKTATAISPIKEKLIPTGTGFLWNDFTEAVTGATASERGPSVLEFGESFTKQFLKACNKPRIYEIKVIFRGHQHSGEIGEKMDQHHGIYNLWAGDILQWDGQMKTIDLMYQEPVWTIHASAASKPDEKSGHIYDTYVILHLNKEYGKWHIEPRKVKIK